MTPKSQHTPGPWEAGQWNNTWETAKVRHVLTGNILADVFGKSPVATANARLIAAAPELLEALRELVTRCDGEPGVRADGSNIDTMQAHAALDKAEGGWL